MLNFIQTFQICASLLAIGFALPGCSTNPATGAQQFTGLMSPAKEAEVGAKEHQKIIARYGLYDSSALQVYIEQIGQRVTAKTERPEVTYSFHLLDTPMVNAFAVPGGYIYVTRGLLALANNEAQLAGVLGHEAGHITARHSAERYSHAVVTSVGGSILSLLLDSGLANQALGLGSDLYLKGYSRTQEHEADSLGARYMAQGGYDPAEISAFLKALKGHSELIMQQTGAKQGPIYFSTHPDTDERVARTAQQAADIAQTGGRVGRADYLKAINGLTYGDSAKQGFARGRDFYHPQIGFTFTVPDGYRFINQSDKVIAKDKDSQALLIFDMASSKGALSAREYLQGTWLQGKSLQGLEDINVDGMRATTAHYKGKINGTAMTIRVLAAEWSPGRFARFQMALPDGLSTAQKDALDTASQSLRRLSAAEKQSIKPDRITVVTAKAGDTVSSLSKTHGRRRR